VKEAKAADAATEPAAEKEESSDAS
jgi:hypothetical protein